MIYLMGDLQGCCQALERMLQTIEFSPSRDHLFVLGDLVNRGPDSLGVLRRLRGLDNAATCLLGNHDLHLLAVSEGYGKVHADDTIQPILDAAESKVLLDWLRCQPLMIYEQGYAMVHAGLLPEWSIKKALRLAEEVEYELSGQHHRQFLGKLYGNKPVRWQDDLKGMDRLRLIVNAMTRMRFITQDGELDLSYKGELDGAPPHLLPWFEAATRRSVDTPIICGHWSALGLHMDDDVLAIDSGCLWGGSLTAVRLEDRAVFSLPCQAYREISR